MTIQTYSDLPGINWSTLRSMQDSPLHYRHAVEHPRSDTAAMRLGRAVHCAVLEPERFRRDYVIYDGKVQRGKAFEAFLFDNADKEILTTGEHSAALVMANAVSEHPLAQRYLQRVPLDCKEIAIQWTDPRTNLPCKARIDAWDRERVIDLKTAQSVTPREFGRSAARYSYHCQLAYYQDGLYHSGARPAEHWQSPIIIAVQSSPPYDVAVYEVPGSVIRQGRAIYRALLQRVKECMETQRWPGVCDDEELVLTLPSWAGGYDEGDESVAVMDNETPTS